MRAKLPGWVRALIIFGVAMLLFSLYGRYQKQQESQAAQPIPLSEAVSLIQQGEVKSIVIEVGGAAASIETSNGQKKQVILGGSSETFEKVVLDYNAKNPDRQIRLSYKSADQTFQWVGQLLLAFLPLIFIAGLFLFMMRRAQEPGNQALSFGKSKAKMFVGHQQKVTFADVAGCDEAKQELGEVVEFLKYPEKFSAIGARIPRGVLLVGPPGCGKTLLARAVAGEAGVPFFSISGSEFVEMFVGVGAARVRDLFEQAKRNAPCIVFMDEVDAIGRQRGAGLGGSHDEREQALNQILVEMDGFDQGTNVIVIAATNRPDILDPALIRPGRFDRQVVVDRPDIRGRKEILDVHVKGKPLAQDVELLRIAKISPGFTGADLANIVNEAAILAARRNRKTISMDEFANAFEKVALGPERKSRVISKEEKRIIAIHEGGHALVMAKTPLSDPVHKVSIVARGMVGGVTWSLPEEDRQLLSRGRLLAKITGALGGYAAEYVVLGGINAITTGPSDDLKKATELARRMVIEWGMSEELGPQTFGKRQDLIFLGKQVAEEHDYSDEVARRIDEQVKSIIDGCYAKAKEVITENIETLERIMKRLLVVETLEGEEFANLVSNNAPTGSK